MAGGTHVFDMIKQLRNNENLRIRKYFKRQNLKTGSRHPITEDGILLSQKEKATLIETIKLSEKHEQKITVLLLGVAIVITIIFVYLFLQLFHFLVD